MKKLFFVCCFFISTYMYAQTPIVENDDENKVFAPHEIQEQAEFIGGNKEFYKFLSENIKVPKQARRMGIEGKVYVEFIIEKNGDISNLKNKSRDANNCIDDEVIRVLKVSPKWKPAKLNGKNVRQSMKIPVYLCWR